LKLPPTIEVEPKWYVHVCIEDRKRAAGNRTKQTRKKVMGFDCKIPSEEDVTS
jgi:hypothetical protein